MCSYNQVNGKFACNHSELLGYLRQWGFDGFIAPDAAFALRDALTGALAGVTRVGGKEVGTFIKQEKLKVSDLDRMLYYNLTPYFRLGIYDSPSKGKPDADVSTPEHQAFARKVAEEGAVLLKNKGGVLPIDPARVKSIAVIGDDAGPHVTIGLNGSGHVYATKVSVPIDAITARAGNAIKVTYVQGTAGIGPLPAIPASVMKPEHQAKDRGFWHDTSTAADSNGIPVVSRVEPGVKDISGPPAEFYSALGLPAPVPGVEAFHKECGALHLRQAPAAELNLADASGPRRALLRRGGSMRRSSLVCALDRYSEPPSTGTYVFSITGSGTAQLYVDHKLVSDHDAGGFRANRAGHYQLEGRASRSRRAEVLQFCPPSWDPGWRWAGSRRIPTCWRRPIAAAKQSDIAIVFAAEQMGEGQDKVTLALPGDQDNLIHAVAQANPRTVVVLHTLQSGFHAVAG